MIEWTVDSWVDEKVCRFHLGEIAFQDIPNVLAVHLPHTINSKSYSTRMIGSDWYFRETPMLFGAWTDPNQPWAGDHVGYTLLFDKTGFKRHRFEVPEFLIQKPIPEIMLPDEMWEAYHRGEL